MSKSKMIPEQKARRSYLGQLMEGAGIKSIEDIHELFKDVITTTVNQGLEGELDEELNTDNHLYDPDHSLSLT